MNRGIFAAAGGMRSNQILLDVLSNNIANVSTTGFKRDGVAFADMLERELTVPGARFERPVGSIGAGATIGAKYTDTGMGALLPTGNPLDVALTEPNHFFMLETPAGIRYSRDGALSIDSQGFLVNQSGHNVLDQNGTPIVIGLDAVREIGIDRNGAVRADGAPVAFIAIRQGSLEKVGDNLWDGNTRRVDNPTLATGALEGSNVNAIEAMVQMIGLMRNFEMAQRAIQTQDEMTGHLIQSLSR